MSAATFASPGVDYSQGKVAVDINLRPSADISKSNSAGNSWDMNGRNNNLDVGATIGLGGFAFQYKNSNIKTKDFTFGGSAIYKEEVSAKEYNVLYKIDKTFSVFAGIINTKFDVAGVNFVTNLQGKGVTGFQIGVIGILQWGKILMLMV